MYQKAEVFFKKKDWKQAEMHYRATVDLDGEDARYMTALAWCIYNNELRAKEARIPEAKKRLIDIHTEHKEWGDAAYRLGLINRAENNEEEAQVRFRQAVMRDPKHEEAQKEVRVIERQEEAKKTTGPSSGKGGGSFLDRFKKK